MGACMQLTPYRRAAPRVDLPRQHASCTDDSAPHPCDLAEPRALFAHPRWRWVWLGLSAFGASAITAIALSTVMPSGNIDLGERALRKRPIVAQLRRPTRSASLLVGAVHDPASLFAYAQEAKREGNDITLVDAWVSAQSMPRRATTFEDALGISSMDVVMSVDGFATTELTLAGDDYRRHIVELRRDGRIVVISVRESG